MKVSNLCKIENEIKSSEEEEGYVSTGTCTHTLSQHRGR
jgi:hypothetical protein